MVPREGELEVLPKAEGDSVINKEKNEGSSVGRDLNVFAYNYFRVRQGI